MTFELKFLSKTVKLNVLNKGLDLGTSSDVGLLGECLVLPHISNLNFLDNFLESKLNIIDFGGSGDCFFLCLNSALSFLKKFSNDVKIKDIDTWYQDLNLPFNTYIEESHLKMVSNAVGFSLIICSSVNGDLVSCRFGEFDNFIVIFNDYPFHYYLFEKLYFNGIYYYYDNLPLPPNEIVEEQKTNFISERKPLEISTGNKIYSDPLKNEIEDPSISFLYQYVDSRLELKRRSMKLTPMDSKIYYKLRHNLFKTTFLDLLSIPSTKELPFSFYGIPSNRTPDVLMQLSDFWLIIEFTVVKNESNALRNKKSKSKYDYEVELIRKSGFKVFVFYPTLVLSNTDKTSFFDILEISDLLNKEFFIDPEKTLSDLHLILNELEFNISEFMPELLMNDEVSVKVNFKEEMALDEFTLPFSVMKKQSGAKRQRSQNIFNRIKKKSFEIERNLKKVAFKAKFKIFVNNKTNNVYAATDPDGVSKNVLLTMVQNNSLELLNHVKLIGDFDNSDDPFKLYGESDLIIDDAREQDYYLEFNTEAYEMEVFRRLSKADLNDSNLQLLSQSSLSKQIDNVEVIYDRLLNIKRLNTENSVIYNKNVFIFPISMGLKEGEFIPFTFKTGKTLTDILISRVKSVKRSDKTISRNFDYDKMNSLMQKQNLAYRKLLDSLGNNFKLARKLKNVYKEETWVKIASEEGLELSNLTRDILREHSKLKNEITLSISEPTRKAYQNRISITNSAYRKSWPDEMQHFNEKKGNIKICEEFDMTELKVKFDQLLEVLFCPTLTRCSDDIHSSTDPIGKEFSEICLEMLQVVEESKDKLLKSNLMKNLLFISRLCYSVLYLSNIKLNKEDFMFDNLGYENALVFVKGGKKIIATKRTRLFSLIFPINDTVSWLYKSRFTKIQKDSLGNMFCVLPWQSFHFNMAKKGTELYFSFSNYFLTTQIESGLDFDRYTKFVSAKVLNMFSQRRKVEIWFGSFRYLYLNSLATHTSVLELIESMVDHDYDPYFYYIQRLFSRNYKNICEHASKLEIYDIVTNEVFDNFDLCAEKFDESIFMTMAPFDRDNEHMRNLKSILETHSYYKKHYSMDPMEMLKESSVNAFDEDYVNKLFNDDFKFDPKLNFSIGKFAGEFLSRVTSKEVLANEFTKIMQSSYTDISTSKGMRGGDKFWGSKGHDVLFSNPQTLSEVLNFMDNLPNNYKEYSNTLDEHEATFLAEIEKMGEIILEFDAKDKPQWKGSREIYVMSETTKLVQQPLEKFFKLLCQWTPNELIHKKSHVRPKFIHSQVFEYDSSEDVKTYCTLDCRKWAPRSNIWKYYYFVMGMSSFLPIEFVDYFKHIWSLMFKKKIRIQKRYVDIIKGNKKTAHLFDHLVERSDGDFELDMPYSFMMGIYNYLSTLLHAFTQLYFNEKISSKFGVIVNLIAHSDDSGGVIISKSYQKNLDTFARYEIFQKACNHLMSKKKSSLSEKFFEMISIMYANKRLIPMTHKFLGNLSFEPKGKGWVDDISTIVSKVVELFSNGATMLQCYLTMITMSEMIRKFYHLPRFHNLSRIPLAFGGVFNMHPIHLILLGADAQEIMLDILETEDERSFRIRSYISLCGDYFPGKGTQTNYQIQYYKKHEMDTNIDKMKMRKMKTISSCIPKRTLGKKLQHFSQLSDQSYIYSLSGVDMCQIFVMTLFTKTYIIKGDNKRCDMRKFTKHYSIMNKLKVGSEHTDTPFSQYHNYMKAAEGIRIKMSDMSIKSMKTCKPITYTTFQNIGLGLSFQTVNEIIAYNSPDDLKFMFEDYRKMDVLTSWVKNTLPESSKFSVFEYLMKLSSKDLEKTRSCYTFLPSGVSVDTIERFWTYINFYCTRRYWISEKRPQFFTIDQYRLWSLNYDSVKHYYLLVKLINSKSKLDEKFKKAVRDSANCKGCKHTEGMINMVEVFFEINDLKDGESYNTNLPFAVYHTKQHRNTNVWYGQCEFTIYSMFGEASLRKSEEGMSLNLNLLDGQTPDELYFLFKNFVQTRGMFDMNPIYSINDSINYKIGFSDLNQPMIFSPGSRGMMLTNSIVTYTSSVRVRNLKKIDKNMTYYGENVDFEIYQNYDINKSFFEEHCLENLKSEIFGGELVVKKDDFLINILSSKTYKVLALDDRHFSYSTIEDKYDNEGLLGSSCSFTRALMLATKKGITNYRSNVNPILEGKALFEGQSYKDIPILDLVNECSFSRINYRERSVLENLIQNEKLNEVDKSVLDRIILKLGLKPTLSAITLMKTVFNALSYRDVVKLPKLGIQEFLYTMIKSSLNSILNKPKTKNIYQAKGTVANICNKLILMLKCKSPNSEIGEYLAQLFLRAHLDNPGKFWELRRDSLYCSLYNLRFDLMKSQSLFLTSCLNFNKGKDDLNKLYTIRQLILATKEMSASIKKFSKKKGLDYLSDRLRIEYDERNFFIGTEDDDELEEQFDLIQGGEAPDNLIERTWDEDLDEAEFTLVSQNSILKFAEESLVQDYSTLTLISIFPIKDYRFLGYADLFEEVDKFGVHWYVAMYPGKTKPESSISKLPDKEIVRKNITEIEFSEEKIEKKVYKKTDLFKFDNDEELFSYQVEMLRDNGVNNPESFSRYFFKMSDISNENLFWKTFFDNMNLKVLKSGEKKVFSRRVRTTVLPGFTGNLMDKKIKSELKSLFGNHVEQLISGNHSISSSLYKNIIMSARRLFRTVSDDEKGILVMILALMKDAIISENSDDWFTNPIFDILNDLDEKMFMSEPTGFIAPAARRAEIIYSETYEYDE